MSEPLVSVIHKPSMVCVQTDIIIKKCHIFSHFFRNSQSDTTISNNCHHNSRQSMPYALFADNGNSDSEAFQHENNNNLRDSHGKPRNQKKKLFTRTKSASTSRLNLRNNDAQLRSYTPVENLRRQLQKLEDLEDQFPDNSLDTTYHLRYPFNESGGNSRLIYLKFTIPLWTYYQCSQRI